MWSVFFAVVGLFLYMFDDQLRLNLFPQSWERPVEFICFGMTVIAFGSVAMSGMLSLYRLADKKN